jgi:DNA-damage-inducible protein J
MAKSAMIRARIEPELKGSVDDILKELGLTATEAITLFYNQIRLIKGIPFDIKIPNKTTLKTFKDTDAGKNIVEAKDEKDMFEKLGI